ncbi:MULTISPECIES: ion transporter [Haloferax]|jgi:voltage-gated potassium channel|uniref:Ion transporter n=2 Tax=Haloferax TaxID=2251 RepID=A0A558GEL6_HALVO|nr:MULTISPECIES: ion transporter [Haloferax]MBC9986978.1 ion transporter [Haloferax sp. AS1]NLV03816.1 ion transporter [Haloferax alexandrinus]RDZ31329.1 ion transporter [Haloferax sp. Atlit-48N]RDZ35095.1 ion transporter [Haloferax sp. Atlit-24N]RDZ38822.1 ion transporter [Haloferax sp. Atlit-47N]
MDGHARRSRRETPRDVVRFYLLDHRTAVGKAIDIALLGLNLLFVGVFVAETYPLSASVQSTLWSVEAAVSIVFLAEYLLRLYGARDRTAELLNVYSFVDLLAILPTLAVLVLPVSSVAANIGFLRAIRVVRVLRFYRFTRDEEFFFGTVSVGTLRVMKLLLTVLTIFFVAAGMFYSFEHRVNPNIGSFGDAFYFVVVALSTVGFGDIVPVTEAGRWVTVAAILAGVILIPWQASKIVKEWGHRDKVNVTCQNCGLAYHDADASHCKSCGHVIYQEYDSRE